jgi:hypothetical protein
VRCQPRVTALEDPQGFRQVREGRLAVDLCHRSVEISHGSPQHLKGVGTQSLTESPLMYEVPDDHPPDLPVSPETLPVAEVVV